MNKDKVKSANLIVLNVEPQPSNCLDLAVSVVTPRVLSVNIFHHTGLMTGDDAKCIYEHVKLFQR